MIHWHSFLAFLLGEEMLLYVYKISSFPTGKVISFMY